jgi:hypothetical protein
VVIEAANRRGEHFQCRVQFIPIGSDSGDGASAVIMLMEAGGDEVAAG